MKNRWAILAFSIFLFSQAQAQTDSSKKAVSADTTTINLYGGLVGTGFVSVDSGTTKKWAQLRVGAMMKRYFSKSVFFYGWVGYDPGYSATFFRASIHKTWNGGGMSAGYQPTVVGSIKPFPFCVDAQMEFAAEGMIPGAALGASIWHKNWKVGYYTRNRKPEYQAAYQAKILSVGIWTPGDKFGGATAKVELDRLYFLASITGEKEKGVVISAQPVKKFPYKVVWDFATNDNKITTNFIGIQHNFDTKKFSAARMGIGADLTNSTVGMYLLLSMNYNE